MSACGWVEVGGPSVSARGGKVGGAGHHYAAWDPTGKVGKGGGQGGREGGGEGELGSMTAW